MVPPLSLVDADWYLDHLEEARARYGDVLATGDLDAPVPACPGWTLTDLTQHLGRVHRWALTAIVEADPSRPPADPDAAAPPAAPDSLAPPVAPHAAAPRGRDGLRSWLDDGAAQLIAILRGTDPATAAWGFGPHPRVAGFWFRRQAHETALHTWDALASQGRRGRLPLRLAEDGIDEVVGVFFPRQVRLGRIGPIARPVALRATDAVRPGAADWLLADDGTSPEPSAPPAATLAGPAEDLLLLLWRRIGLEASAVEITGDAEAARAVLATDLTP